MEMAVARLDKNQRYVLCGLTDCGARLAYVGHKPLPETEDEPILGGPEGLVQFLEGWAPGHRDGVWSFSKYARRRRRAGRSVKLRSWPTGGGAARTSDVMDDFYEPLLVKGKCPECGFVNLIAEEQVGVGFLLLRPADPVDGSGNQREPVD